MICEKTVKRFCCDDASLIENYDKAVADTTQTWSCHHKMELIKTGAVVDSTMQDLKDWGIYYNRPADELIFLTHSEHSRLHHKGKKYSEETKKKIGDGSRGRRFSVETKMKMSEAHKGRAVPKYCIGKHWFNNGVESILAFECPEGFVKGRIHRRKSV